MLSYKCTKKSWSYLLLKGLKTPRAPPAVPYIIIYGPLVDNLVFNKQVATSPK